MQADEGAWSSDEPIDTEREFMQVMQDYKWRSGRMFPTRCEILEVLRSLGYRKPAGSQQT